MAWITKNSADIPVERQKTPWFDAEMQAYATQELLPRYPDSRGALIPVLHLVQDKHNWLPMQAIQEIAAYLNIQPSEVIDTATFYEEFFLEERGTYTLWVCRSVSCEIMGGQNVLDQLSVKLGIAEGETTKDGKITLMPVECIGACGGAPCALINHCLVEDVNLQNIDELIARLDQLDPHAIVPSPSFCDGICSGSNTEGQHGDA